MSEVTSKVRKRNIKSILTAVVCQSTGGTGTVESVTGDGVDNTDPANPVISFPAPAEIGAQSIAVVVSSNQIAVNDGVYVNVASATYTDPTPAEGKGFTVFVRNGTATVGGTAYAVAGTIVRRIFHSGGWANYPVTVSDEAYGVSWNGSLEVPTKNAVYDKLNSLLVEYLIRPTANQSTSSNVEVDIDGIYLDLQANSEYQIVGFMGIGCNNTGGVRFAFVAPSDATARRIMMEGITTSATAFVRAYSTSDTIVSTSFATVNTGGNGGHIRIDGVIKTVGAGIFKMRFASAVNGQTSTVYLENSVIRILKIA